MTAVELDVIASWCRAEQAPEGKVRLVFPTPNPDTSGVIFTLDSPAATDELLRRLLQEVDRIRWARTSTESERRRLYPLHPPA